MVAKKRTVAKSGSKAGSNTVKRGNKQGEDTNKGTKEPYALVLYNDGSKGVVEVKSIPKKFRVKGSACKAPNPIDWAVGHLRPGTKDATDATLIDFGCKLRTSV